MATKDSTLIIEVDLQCEKCYKKIQKILCKLQSKEDIRRFDFDNAKNTVIISGRFDPAKMSKKLRCKACDVIKDIKIKPQEEKKPAEEKTKKPEEKKPEAKKPEDKKPAEEKAKKPEEKKPAEEKKGGGDEKAKAPPPPPTSSSSNTTLNLQFTNMCGICYPWPCSDPAHWGIHHPQQMMPQWPPCGGMAPAPAPAPLPAPVHHPHPPCGGAPQKWAPCGGPSFCGGCGWCHGGGMRGGWAPPPAQPMCCPGPSLCRGCNGCKIVHETKFSYEEYPSSACAIM